MNCEEALILLSGHIDGQNTAEEEAALQAHLAICAACRGVLQAYEEINAGVAELATEPPKDLRSSVMEKITEHPAERRRRRRFWLGSGTAVAAAAAVLVLLVSAGKLPNFRQSRAASSQASANGEAVPATTKAGDGQENEESAAKASDNQTASAEVQPEDGGAAPSEQHAADETDAVNGDNSAGMPMTMAAEAPEDDAIAVELVDNPDSPAAETITELSGMMEEDAVDGSAVQFWGDAATVRSIVQVYSETYDITVPETLELAEDGTPCVIRVVEP